MNNEPTKSKVTRLSENILKEEKSYRSVLEKTFEPGNENAKPEFSLMSGGGSTSEMSVCSIDFDVSPTENGILHLE